MRSQATYCSLELNVVQCLPQFIVSVLIEGVQIISHSARKQHGVLYVSIMHRNSLVRLRYHQTSQAQAR